MFVLRITTVGIYTCSKHIGDSGETCVCPGGEAPKRRGRKPKSEKLLLLQQQEQQGSGNEM